MLKYIGKGAALVVDQVPARDLKDEEVAQFGEVMLLESGLYEKVKTVSLGSRIQIGNDLDFPDAGTTVKKAGK